MKKLQLALLDFASEKILPILKSSMKLIATLLLLIPFFVSLFLLFVFCACLTFLSVPLYISGLIDDIFAPIAFVFDCSDRAIDWWRAF